MRIGILVVGRIRIRKSKNAGKLISSISRATDCYWHKVGDEWITTEYNVVSNLKGEILKTILEEFKDYLVSACVRVYTTQLRDLVVFNKLDKSIRLIKPEEKT